MGSGRSAPAAPLKVVPAQEGAQHHRDHMTPHHEQQQPEQLQAKQQQGSHQGQEQYYQPQQEQTQWQPGQQQQQQQGQEQQSHREQLHCQQQEERKQHEQLPSAGPAATSDPSSTDHRSQLTSGGGGGGADSGGMLLLLDLPDPLLRLLFLALPLQARHALRCTCRALGHIHRGMCDVVSLGEHSASGRNGDHHEPRDGGADDGSGGDAVGEWGTQGRGPEASSVPRATPAGAGAAYLTISVCTQPVPAAEGAAVRGTLLPSQPLPAAALAAALAPAQAAACQASLRQLQIISGAAGAVGIAASRRCVLQADGTDALSAALATCGTLRELRLALLPANGPQAAPFAAVLAALTQLTALQLGFTSRHLRPGAAAAAAGSQAVAAAWLQSFSSLPNLEFLQLDLDGCAPWDLPLASLAPLTSLQYLIIAAYGGGPGAVRSIRAPDGVPERLTALRELRLPALRAASGDLATLCALPGLQLLQLGGCSALEEDHSGAQVPWRSLQLGGSSSSGSGYGGGGGGAGVEPEQIDLVAALARLPLRGLSSLQITGCQLALCPEAYEQQQVQEAASALAASPAFMQGSSSAAVGESGERSSDEAADVGGGCGRAGRSLHVYCGGASAAAAAAALPALAPCTAAFTRLTLGHADLTDAPLVRALGAPFAHVQQMTLLAGCCADAGAWRQLPEALPALRRVVCLRQPMVNCLGAAQQVAARCRELGRCEVLVAVEEMDRVEWAHRC